MTGEEMERAIGIILNNEANFELQFEKTNQQIEVTNKRLSTFIEETDKRFGIFAETQTEFIQITSRHIEAQGEINASLRGILRELKESQTRTDERLGGLTETVERHISEGHHGKT
jgi:hypothetical protein